MDKSDFVRLAPKYYMLAIIQEMRKSYGHLSETAMRESYTYNDPGGDDYCYIPNKYLMKIALDNLASTGAIEIIKDDFGPALYRKTDQFEQAVEALEIDLDGPFYKCKVSPDCEAWVRSALSKVNDTSTELDITGEDFNRPDQEWAPIPLDHDNKSLKTAIDLLDKVTQQIEQSNGYAAAYPEERNFRRRQPEPLVKPPEDSRDDLTVISSNPRTERIEEGTRKIRRHGYRRGREGNDQGDWSLDARDRC